MNYKLKHFSRHNQYLIASYSMSSLAGKLGDLK